MSHNRSTDSDVLDGLLHRDSSGFGVLLTAGARAI